MASSGVRNSSSKTFFSKIFFCDNRFLLASQGTSSRKYRCSFSTHRVAIDDCKVHGNATIETIYTRTAAIKLRYRVK